MTVGPLAIATLATFAAAGVPNQAAVRITPPEGPSLVTHPRSYFKDVIRTIHSHEGTLWFGTYGSGLFALEGARLRRLTHATSPLLEDRVNALASIWGKTELDRVEVKAARDKTADEKLLNGPALKGQGISQDEIDKLFG